MGVSWAAELTDFRPSRRDQRKLVRLNFLPAGRPASQSRGRAPVSVVMSAMMEQAAELPLRNG